MEESTLQVEYHRAAQILQIHLQYNAWKAENESAVDGEGGSSDEQNDAASDGMAAIKARAKAAKRVHEGRIDREKVAGSSTQSQLATSYECPDIKTIHESIGYFYFEKQPQQE